MAKKPTLNDIAANGFAAISTYNANQDAIEAAFENTISRDGSTPNTMEANFDMNSNRIINLLDPVNNQEAVTKAYVDALALAVNTFDITDSVLSGTKAELTALTPAASIVQKQFLVTDTPQPSIFIYNTTDISSTLITATVTSTAINTSTETITSASHGLYTGQAVYTETTVNGVTANTFYYIIFVDTNNFKLATSYSNAVVGTAINLTGTTNFTLKRHIDPLSAVYIIPNGLALDGSQGSWKLQLPDSELNPLWFGASTTLANNAPYFAAAANYRDGYKVLIPEGTFKNTDPIMWDGRTVIWEGVSKYTSKMQWDADVHGFLGGSEGLLAHTGFSNMSILTSVQCSTGMAVKLDFTPGGDRSAGLFQSLFIGGTGYPSTYGIKWWQNGLYMNNAQCPFIFDIIGSGATATTVAEAARCDSLIHLTADSAAVCPIIDKVFCINFNSCVKIRSSSNPAIEGVYINDVNHIFGNVGIDIINGHASYIVPQIFITNCQFENFYRSIHIQGYSEGVISNILSYYANFGNTGPDHIFLDNCANFNISNCSIISRPTNTTVKGISINDCDRIDIFDNTFSAYGNELEFTGTTANSTEHDNRFEGTGTNFTDSSSGSATNRGGINLTATGGYSWHGEVLHQWGYGSAFTDVNGDITITFPKAFNTIFTPMICNADGTATTVAPVLMGWSTTGVTIRYPGYTSAPAAYSWMAVGK